MNDLFSIEKLVVVDRLQDRWLPSALRSPSGSLQPIVTAERTVLMKERNKMGGTQ